MFELVVILYQKIFARLRISVLSMYRVRCTKNDYTSFGFSSVIRYQSFYFQDKIEYFWETWIRYILFL